MILLYHPLFGLFIITLWTTQLQTKIQYVKLFMYRCGNSYKEIKMQDALTQTLNIHVVESPPVIPPVTPPITPPTNPGVPGTGFLNGVIQWIMQNPLFAILAVAAVVGLIAVIILAFKHGFSFKKKLATAGLVMLMIATTIIPSLANASVDFNVSDPNALDVYIVKGEATSASTTIQTNFDTDVAEDYIITARQDTPVDGITLNMEDKITGGGATIELNTSDQAVYEGTGPQTAETLDFELTVNIDSSLAVGTYTTSIDMAAEILGQEPTITSIANDTTGGGATGSIEGGDVIIITGTFFYDDQITTGVTIGGNPCAITEVTSTTITCTLPAGVSTTPVDVVVTTAFGTATATGGFTYVAPVCASGFESSNDCQVDIDANLLPIKYTGSATTPEWTVASLTEADGAWYDYENQIWANAVSTKADFTPTGANSDKYWNADDTPKAGAVIDDADVLGYWVYVPRYAYEVQRRDAVDKPITAQTAFDIRFEKKLPQARKPRRQLVQPAAPATASTLARRTWITAPNAVLTEPIRHRPPTPPPGRRTRHSPSAPKN